MNDFRSNPFRSPRSLSDSLERYDFDVCEHADDAADVIQSLVTAGGHTVSHNREISMDTDNMELVIEVQLEIRVSNPDWKKVQ